MSLVADGNSGLEHNVPPERFYDDVLQFWSATDVAYTPTLVVTYGGPGSEFFFYQESDVWTHPILSRYVPPHILQPRAVRRQMAPASDYQAFRDSAANGSDCWSSACWSTPARTANAKASARTGNLGIRAGRDVADAGVASGDASIRRSTRNREDLGSIENGKLADLLIVDGNPLDDIRVTDDIAYVVLNGRIYEGGTLTEKVTGQRKLQPFYW